MHANPVGDNRASSRYGNHQPGGDRHPDIRAQDVDAVERDHIEKSRAACRQSRRSSLRRAAATCCRHSRTVGRDDLVSLKTSSARRSRGAIPAVARRPHCGDAPAARRYRQSAPDRSAHADAVACRAAASPAIRPKVTAAQRPIAGRYPQNDGPETPRAAPPPAKTLRRAVPSARRRRASSSTCSPP